LVLFLCSFRPHLCSLSWVSSPLPSFLSDVPFETKKKKMLKRCEDKSSMKPWDGLVERLGSFDVHDRTTNVPAAKRRSVIVLHGSRGCGKSVTLKAVGERVVKEHRVPNVVRLRLGWDGEKEAWLDNCLSRSASADTKQNSTTTNPEEDERKKVAAARDEFVADALLSELDYDVDCAGRDDRRDDDRPFDGARGVPGRAALRWARWQAPVARGVPRGAGAPSHSAPTRTARGWRAGCFIRGFGLRWTTRSLCEPLPR
jgi:hypothetical protein